MIFFMIRCKSKLMGKFVKFLGTKIKIISRVMSDDPTKDTNDTMPILSGLWSPRTHVCCNPKKTKQQRVWRESG